MNSERAICRSLIEITCSKQVEVGVSPQHPEAIVVPAEGLHSGSLGHVPHPDAFVLRVGENELLTWVEDGAGHIVVVTAARVQLPGLGFWGRYSDFVMKEEPEN